MTNPRGPMRSITTAQIIGIVAATLALFFMVAFATKSVDAIRLRTWRDQLEGEIEAMRREHEELVEEARRRNSVAWAEEVLRDAGQVRSGMVSVIAVTATPGPTAAPTPEATPIPEETVVPHRAPFDNPNWDAWWRLFTGKTD
ncbi:MAG TPA: hypothetical protein GX714_03650 [Chloroflexi bacterium]|jgi:hypothetical protein|nr:hypothetical protein [Chloroflexota bacterium]